MFTSETIWQELSRISSLQKFDIVLQCICKVEQIVSQMGLKPYLIAIDSDALRKEENI